jgi:hypothetical protein
LLLVGFPVVLLVVVRVVVFTLVLLVWICPLGVDLVELETDLELREIVLAEGVGDDLVEVRIVCLLGEAFLEGFVN